MTARCIECGIDAEEVRRLRARVKDLEQKVAETRSTEANERTVSWQHAAAVQERMRYVNEHRERLLEAWFAETGLKPSESVLCTSDSFEDGKMVTRCWVERKKDDDG